MEEPKKFPLKSIWDPSKQLELVFSGGSHENRSYGMFDEFRIYSHAHSREPTPKIEKVCGEDDTYIITIGDQIDRLSIQNTSEQIGKVGLRRDR